MTHYSFKKDNGSFTSDNNVQNLEELNVWSCGLKSVRPAYRVSRVF